MVKKTVQLGTARFDMTPFYMAKLACDIFDAASLKRSESKRPWFKYLMYCIAIELALKAILLNNNNTQDQKKLNKKIGHNLVELRMQAAVKMPDEFFEKEMIQTIESISPFFASKSLEYVSTQLLGQMMIGGKALPDITALEDVARKFITYLQDQKHFINSDTLD